LELKSCLLFLRNAHAQLASKDHSQNLKLAWLYLPGLQAASRNKTTAFRFLLLFSLCWVWKKQFENSKTQTTISGCWYTIYIYIECLAALLAASFESSNGLK
jgi:hypothetical protein